MGFILPPILALKLFRQHYRTGLAWKSINCPLALKGTQVTHGCGLAGKTEMSLDFPGGGHHSRLTMGVPEKIEKFLLSIS